MSDCRIRIRAFELDDYPQVRRLWERGEPGVHLRPSDELDEIKQRLKRDQDLFLVAEDQKNVIGVLIAGWDGRRGSLSHLVVDPAMRGKGVGSSLIAEAEERLRKKGCLRVHMLVYGENTRALALYKRLGYEPMEPIVALGKNL